RGGMRPRRAGPRSGADPGRAPTGAGPGRSAALALHGCIYSPRPRMAEARIFSGIQPTGRKHLGNYVGAIRQYVDGQDRGEGIYCIVDLHAITVPQDPAQLREQLHDTTAILIAAGLDPKR